MKKKERQQDSSFSKFSAIVPSSRTLYLLTGDNPLTATLHQKNKDTQIKKSTTKKKSCRTLIELTIFGKKKNLNYERNYSLHIAICVCLFCIYEHFELNMLLYCAFVCEL